MKFGIVFISFLILIGVKPLLADITNKDLYDQGEKEWQKLSADLRRGSTNDLSSYLSKKVTIGFFENHLTKDQPWKFQDGTMMIHPVQGVGDSGFTVLIKNPPPFEPYPHKAGMVWYTFLGTVESIDPKDKIITIREVEEFYTHAR